MNDERQPELREPANMRVIRKWLKESFHGAEWEDGNVTVDFDETPLDELLGAVFDWNDRCLTEELKRLGYSSEAIREFRESRSDLASAVDGPAVPIGPSAVIDSAKQHPGAREIYHMLLIDGFQVLRAAQWFAGQAKFGNVLRYLQLYEKHLSIFREKEWPSILGAKGGLASTKKRREQKSDRLDVAARAYQSLLMQREYTMREPKKKEIEDAAGLRRDSLRKFSKKKIRVRAAELRDL